MIVIINSRPQLTNKTVPPFAKLRPWLPKKAQVKLYHSQVKRLSLSQRLLIRTNQSLQSLSLIE